MTTAENLKILIRSNIIQNYPVTGDDVDETEDILVPDISVLKGKSTRSRPEPVKAENIEVLQELITQHLDSFCVLTSCS